jgi:ABC-type lipoprotein export system ATPase subunit
MFISELNRDRGTAFVFATHDPNLAEFAKKNLRMKDGGVSEGVA